MRYEQWLGKRNTLISFVVIGIVTYIVLALWPSIWTLPFILGFYFIRGVHIPIVQDYVNALVASDIRATVLSVKNLAQKLLYASLGPIIGVAVDLYSLQTAMLFSGIVYGFLGILALIFMKKVKIF